MGRLLPPLSLTLCPACWGLCRLDLGGALRKVPARQLWQRHGLRRLPALPVQWARGPTAWPLRQPQRALLLPGPHRRCSLPALHPRLLWGPPVSQGPDRWGRVRGLWGRQDWSDTGSSPSPQGRWLLLPGVWGPRPPHQRVLGGTGLTPGWGAAASRWWGSESRARPFILCVGCFGH